MLLGGQPSALTVVVEQWKQGGPGDTQLSLVVPQVNLCIQLYLHDAFELCINKCFNLIHLHDQLTVGGCRANYVHNALYNCTLLTSAKKPHCISCSVTRACVKQNIQAVHHQAMHVVTRPPDILISTYADFDSGTVSEYADTLDQEQHQTQIWLLLCSLLFEKLRVV